MNLVVLTNGSSHGQTILRALRSRNLSVSTIVIERPPKRRIAEIRRSIRKYDVWETALDILAFFRRSLIDRGAADILEGPFNRELIASCLSCG